MIEFLSLYLGLLTGVQPVEVVVGAEVARVEFRLDGDRAGAVEAEPWCLKVDFGPRLAPRRLVAVAFDDTGGEIGRTEQLVNLPRRAAEAGIVLERDDEGKATAARVTWQSVARARPRDVRATFDGSPLAVDDPARIALPDHDPRRFHLLVVDLRFTDRIQAQAVASFGGSYLNTVSTELTALPMVPARRRMPPLDELEGTVVKAGRPLPVVSLEKGQADLLFVRDIAAGDLIEQMGAEGADGVGGFGVSGATGVGTTVSGISASPAEELRRMLTLDDDVRIRLMWPATRHVDRDEVRMDLFPASPPTTAAEGGVYWALTQTVMLEGLADVQRLTDAVAVAGLEAVADNRRRAVVLVLGPEARDESLYDPAGVRDYLRVLGVPLYVWAVGVKERDAAFPEWGEVEAISSLQGLRRATRRVAKDLEQQRILWVDGRHLPQELEIAPAAAVEPAVH